MSEKDEFSMTINFAEDDAAFLSELQEHAQPTFLGEYTPKYLDNDDMSELSWEDTSQMAKFQEDMGFTLDDEQISAMILDLREYDPEVIEVIDQHIDKLAGLKELIVILSETQSMFDFSQNTKLQYVEIRKLRKPLDLPDVSELVDLVVLVVSARLDDVPDLSSNINLQRLVMRNTAAQSFPESITTLKKLVWLEFGNAFDIFPEEALNLENLVVLDLISDDLKSLPDDFGTFSKLQHLSLETDSLKELPPTFNQFEHITDLYLWNLPFEVIPESIFELTTLKFFWFKENSKLRGYLREIPEGIGDLVNLQDLQLNGHEIKEIPDSIGNLENLELLNLSINRLSRFHPSILKLKNLQRLELYLNPISELPEDIGDLANLSYLDISDTKITEIPESIAKLRKLRDFDALGCDLQGLPSSMANLNYTKISSFLISLHKKPEEILDPEIQDWIEKLIKYANDNEEKGIEVEISLYVPEDDKFDENNPELLEDDE